MARGGDMVAFCTTPCTTLVAPCSSSSALPLQQRGRTSRSSIVPDSSRRLVFGFTFVEGLIAASGAASAAVGARAAGRRRCKSSRVDSHLHLWTPDAAKYPFDSPPPANLLDDGRATHESFVKLMDEAGVDHAVVVQPINYWQDGSYLRDAMDAHPSRLKGVFIADPTVKGGANVAADNLEKQAKSHPAWVGVRFNPYKWSGSMSDDVGKAMFQRAGELGLVVSFMPFKGLSKHIDDIEALLKCSPKTQCVIDHMGFFLQPATGIGERALDEKSWQSLLNLSQYPQVSVKISALFRTATDTLPYSSLSDRLKELLSKFGSSRLLWGSDFPFVTEHGDYAANAKSIESWPVWAEMSEAERADVLGGTAIRLFGSFPGDEQCS